MNIDKEKERLSNGILKVNKMILEMEEIGRQDWLDAEVEYDPAKLISLRAQQISIKDRLKLLAKLE